MQMVLVGVVLAVLLHRSPLVGATILLGMSAGGSRDHATNGRRTSSPLGRRCRATLVRSFGRISGVTLLTFLSELRLGSDSSAMSTTRDPITQIAADIGYQSEATLSRGFYRRFGVRPGKSRVDWARRNEPC
jgi:hypothetical protein